MRIVKAEKTALRKRTKLFALLDDFVSSGFECAKIEGGAEHYSEPRVGQFTIRNAIKYFRFYGIKCVLRNGELYLIRTDAEV